MTATDTRIDHQDLVEYYFDQRWSDGLPVVPPTPHRVAAFVDVLGGDPHHFEARIPPRWGSLTTELLAVNMVMAGCKPEYAPVVRAAVLALTDSRFNLNGIQATTHVVSPLIVVNGPMAREIGMNSGGNLFGSGNRANATIGRAVRLIMLSVGGGIPGELDKSTLGHPGKYTFCIAENEQESPWAPYHVEHGYAPEDSTVLVIGAEAPHSVTNHISDDPQGILDSIASAMSTIAHNNAVLGGSCTVVLGIEHARTIANFGWTRDDIRRYLGSTAKTSGTPSVTATATHLPAARPTTATYPSGTRAKTAAGCQSCSPPTTSTSSSPAAPPGGSRRSCRDGAPPRPRYCAPSTTAWCPPKAATCSAPTAPAGCNAHRKRIRKQQ